MPWKETNVMNEKTQFIDAMLKAEKPFKHICADFGISEKTGHKWKNRFFEKFGLCKTDISAQKFIYYIPLIAIVSCNFWLGVRMNGTVLEFVLFAISMLCVGVLHGVFGAVDCLIVAFFAHEHNV